MIPKVINYVWLSGEEKPKLIQDCIASWHRVMPDYQIREWTMEDVKHIESNFLHDALEAQKWAFCTDFLRFYIIYNYGGIYMDSDVYAYKPLDDLLNCEGFTALEGSGILWPEQMNKIQDFGLEAAVFGASKGSQWVKHILNFYSDLKFRNDSDFFLKIIAPKVMWERSLPFGLRKVPSFQLLDGDVKIYPLDTISCVADFSLYGKDLSDPYKIGDINPLRYVCHMCCNSWGWKPKKTLKDKTKDFIIRLIGTERAVSYKRKFKSLIKP